MDLSLAHGLSRSSFNRYLTRDHFAIVLAATLASSMAFAQPNTNSGAGVARDKVRPRLGNPERHESRSEQRKGNAWKQIRTSSQVSVTEGLEIRGGGMSLFRRQTMTNTKGKAERQSKEQSKGNLGQKEAQLEKEKDSDLSHMGEKSSETTQKSS
jgi:hypothetical protein